MDILPSYPGFKLSWTAHQERSEVDGRCVRGKLLASKLLSALDFKQLSFKLLQLYLQKEEGQIR